MDNAVTPANTPSTRPVAMPPKDYFIAGMIVSLTASAFLAGMLVGRFWGYLYG